MFDNVGACIKGKNVDEYEDEIDEDEIDEDEISEDEIEYSEIDEKFLIQLY